LLAAAVNPVHVDRSTSASWVSCSWESFLSCRTPTVLPSAEVFFWSRLAKLVYLVVYYARIPVLRTAVWGVSIVGLAMRILAMPPAP